MNLKKLYIEKALYPAMNLLQNSRVTTYTRELKSTEFMSEQQRALRLRQQLTELLQLCKIRSLLRCMPSGSESIRRISA